MLSSFTTTSIYATPGPRHYQMEMSVRTYYVDSLLASNLDMLENKTLYDLACWIPGRESWSVFVRVRKYAEQLIKDGANLDQTHAPHGDTALIAASRRGNHNFMFFLVWAGASPFSQLSNGNTALHFCAARGDKKGAEILQDKEKWITSVNRRGWDPLALAFYGPEETRLELIRYFLEGGMSVNRRDPGCDSALHLAIGPTKMNQKTVTTPASREIVDLLMHYGADVCHIDFSFKTPLHIVAELRDRNMLHTLLSKAYKHNIGRLISPRMPPFEGMYDDPYTTDEYTEYMDSINEPSRTSLLFIVLRCIEMMKLSFAFALGVRRKETGLQGMSPEMISLITSINVNNITREYKGVYRGRAIQEIAMTALGWMNNTPVTPIVYDWS